MFVKHDPLGNPVDQRHPWNQTTTPRPQKRDFDGKYTWVMSPALATTSAPATTWRSTPAAARSPGSGPRRWRAWWTSATSRRPATASRSTCPRRRCMPEVEFEWKIPKWSNAIERDRARTYFQAYAAAAALYFVEQAMEELHAGRHPDLDRLQGARRGHRLRLPRGGARRALAPRRHPRRQDRQLPPLPADPLERQPARHLRHPRPLRGRGAEHARSSRRTGRTSSRGSTSCGPSAASTRACPAASTCTWATASCSTCGTCRCSAMQK